MLNSKITIFIYNRKFLKFRYCRQAIIPLLVYNMVCTIPSVGHADIISTAFQAEIYSGVDQEGLFGPVGGNLAGDQLIASLSYDTTDFTPQISDGYLAYVSLIPNAASETISINNISYTYDSVSSATLVIFLIEDNSTGQSLYLHNIDGSAENLEFSYNQYIDASIEIAPSPSVIGGGVVALDVLGTPEEDLYFSTATAIPVPEPASIALFGCGLLGLAIWRWWYGDGGLCSHLRHRQCQRMGLRDREADAGWLRRQPVNAAFLLSCVAALGLRQIEVAAGAG